MTPRTALHTAPGVALSVPDTPVSALQGRRIPSRNKSVRKLVARLFRECTWLAGADLPATVRWAVLSERFRRLAERLDGLPELTADNEPRKALAELRALSGEITKLEAALGITAAARAALGVNVGRLGDLAEQMARGPTDGR